MKSLYCQVNINYFKPTTAHIQSSATLNEEGDGNNNRKLITKYRKDKTMVTGTQIRNLAFDMNEIGLDIHDNDDIKEYIERLEEALKTAKFCLSKDAVVNTATL